LRQALDAKEALARQRGQGEDVISGEKKQEFG